MNAVIYEWNAITRTGIEARNSWPEYGAIFSALLKG
jgi:hypothetical protein